MNGDTPLPQRALDSIIFHGSARDRLAAGALRIVTGANGVYVRDSDGREYLDATAGGPYVVGAGYGREEIARAMFEQALEINYTSPYNVTALPTIELAERLSKISPTGPASTFFCTSGSDAVEAGIKFARQYHAANGEPRRYKVISRRHGYHGATLGSIAATGSGPVFSAMRLAADPAVPGYLHAMPPYCHRCELDLEFPSCRLACATTIEQEIMSAEPELVSAVILEPVIGIGCIVPPPGYLQRVREICDRYGILLIADEVITGFGRTGRWFACDHFDIRPDICIVAKGITSGYAALSAAIVRQELVDRVETFWNVHTFGGHPVATRAALVNIDIIERERLVENAALLGDHLVKMLRGLASRQSAVSDVRGIGLFAAVEIARDDNENPPAQVIADRCREMGVLVRAIGPDYVQLAPALTITAGQLDQVVETLDAALTG